MKDLFSQSDFVVSVLPGTEDTRNSIGKAEFSAMKDTSVFISIGRGMVVDEMALNRALESGEILGAALDVYQKEPLPEENPLWERDNLLLTAHNADFTDDYLLTNADRCH